MDCWVPFCFGFPVVLLDLLTLALPLTADSTGVSEGCLCTYSDLCTKCMKGGPCNDKGMRVTRPYHKALLGGLQFVQ